MENVLFLNKSRLAAESYKLKEARSKAKTRAPMNFGNAPVRGNLFGDVDLDEGYSPMPSRGPLFDESDSEDDSPMPRGRLSFD